MEKITKQDLIDFFELMEAEPPSQLKHVIWEANKLPTYYCVCAYGNFMNSLCSFIDPTNSSIVHHPLNLAWKDYLKLINKEAW